MFFFNSYLIYFGFANSGKNIFAECQALGEPKLCRVPADLALGKELSKIFLILCRVLDRVAYARHPAVDSLSLAFLPRAPPLLAPSPSSTPPAPAAALLHAAASRAASPRVPSPPRLAASPRPLSPPAVLCAECGFSPPPSGRGPRPRGAASAPPAASGPAAPRRPRAHY